MSGALLIRNLPIGELLFGYFTPVYYCMNVTDGLYWTSGIKSGRIPDLAGFMRMVLLRPRTMMQRLPRKDLYSVLSYTLTWCNSIVRLVLWGLWIHTITLIRWFWILYHFFTGPMRMCSKTAY